MEKWKEDIPHGHREMEEIELLKGSEYILRPIGWVESTLVTRAMAPKQGDEGAPDAWLVFEPNVIEGLHDLQAGDEVTKMRVRNLEALDATPILDVKPVLDQGIER